MILQYVRAHGSITRRDVVGLCRVSGNQASYLLSKLAERGVLHLVGKGRGAHYELRKTRKMSPLLLGMFSPDYGKVKRMLGLKQQRSCWSIGVLLPTRGGIIGRERAHLRGIPSEQGTRVSVFSSHQSFQWFVG